MLLPSCAHQRGLRNSINDESPASSPVRDFFVFCLGVGVKASSLAILAMKNRVEVSFSDDYGFILEWMLCANFFCPEGLICNS